MKPFKAVLFDLDGTLLDSAPDLVASLNWVRQSEQLAPLPVEEMSQYASKGALGLLNAGMPATDADTLESWRLLFLEHYAKNSYRESRLYDGIPELLEYLAESGISWGIVTNKIESLTFPIIKAADLDGIIGCVVCGDTLAESKPHPAPVQFACQKLGVNPRDTLFVGDDIRDIQAGHAAGTSTAAVYYGYGSAELADESIGASLHIHHPGELLEAVKPESDFLT
ncbi:HAD family hydrolase [Pseudomonadota bacterium]